MRRLMLVVLAFALLGAIPRTADAQAYFSPMVGATFANDAPASKFSTGAALSFLGRAAGFELELGYTPDFFNQQRDDFTFVGDNNVTSFMGTVLVGLGNRRVRPYGAVGAGLLRSRIEEGDLFGGVTTNDFAFNVGGGAFVPLTDRIGVRGDLRYFRSLNDPSNDDDLDVTIGNFDFWRANGALTFRF